MEALSFTLPVAGLPWSGAQVLLEALLAAAALGIAAALRPWRCVGDQGPPWGWCAVWAAVAVLWATLPEGGILRPMTGVTLLVLMAGWPLAVLALLPAALLATLGGNLPWHEALQRLVWIGLVPATCVLAVGAAVRRWLPHHLLAYILGRGFVGTLLASLLAGAALLLASRPPWGVGSETLLVANLLVATGEASICAVLTAILVFVRPGWLATFSERLYRLP
jgi:uncharacterized membrane protein